MGSEMCIRDRIKTFGADDIDCLLYTSVSADDSLRVDLGGGPIIKKVNK